LQSSLSGTSHFASDFVRPAVIFVASPRKQHRSIGPAIIPVALQRRNILFS
jgi:hypothetical protein